MTLCLCPLPFGKKPAPASCAVSADPTSLALQGSDETGPVAPSSCSDKPVAEQLGDHEPREDLSMEDGTHRTEQLQAEKRSLGAAVAQLAADAEKISAGTLVALGTKDLYEAGKQKGKQLL